MNTKKAEILGGALREILEILGEGECPANTCEGCRHDIAEVHDIASQALATYGQEVTPEHKLLSLAEDLALVLRRHGIEVVNFTEMPDNILVQHEGSEATVTGNLNLFVKAFYSTYQHKKAGETT